MLASVDNLDFTDRYARDRNWRLCNYENGYAQYYRDYTSLLCTHELLDSFVIDTRGLQIV